MATGQMTMAVEEFQEFLQLWLYWLYYHFAAGFPFNWLWGAFCIKSILPIRVCQIQVRLLEYFSFLLSHDPAMSVLSQFLLSFLGLFRSLGVHWNQRHSKKYDVGVNSEYAIFKKPINSACFMNCGRSIPGIMCFRIFHDSIPCYAMKLTFLRDSTHLDVQIPEIANDSVFTSSTVM